MEIVQCYHNIIVIYSHTDFYCTHAPTMAFPVVFMVWHWIHIYHWDFRLLRAIRCSQFLYTYTNSHDLFSSKIYWPDVAKNNLGLLEYIKELFEFITHILHYSISIHILMWFCGIEENIGNLRNINQYSILGSISNVLGQRERISLAAMRKKTSAEVRGGPRRTLNSPLKWNFHRRTTIWSEVRKLWWVDNMIGFLDVFPGCLVSTLGKSILTIRSMNRKTLWKAWATFAKFGAHTTKYKVGCGQKAARNKLCL